MSEKILQQQAETYLKSRDIIYIHIENNQHYQKYRKTASQKYKGIPDLIMFLPNATTIFVELKTPTGKMSVEQIQMMGKLESLGFDYYVITSIESFVEAIEKIY